MCFEWNNLKNNREDGKKPIKFVFGEMYLPVLIHANICGKLRCQFGATK